MSEFPQTNHAIILSEYNNNLVRAILGLKKGELNLRILKNNEVLIKVEAAPCNPSDIAFIRGGYNITKTLPAVPGFEGTGFVVETGIDAQYLIGKRVSCFTQANADGTWAEYFISKAEDCIVLKPELDAEQAASLSINPFTAYGLIEMALMKNCRAIIQNAGGGQIAEFIRVLAQMKGMEVIHVVRKEEHVNELKAKGISYVLDSTKENFKEDLKTISNQLNATIAFDAVGGEQTGILLHVLPPHSEVILYGALAGGLISGIVPFDIIFRDKKLSGFNLSEWKAKKSGEEFDTINNLLQDLIISGKLRTKIQASFKLDDAINGIRTYIKSMSDGKILFKP
jgi:NADPH:quinone reductase-like Zn-dependent oxidoreductase